MTKIKPFCALTFNQEKVKDVSKVVCPPYDVISPSAQDYYYNLDEHNLIHILLSKAEAAENKYERAGRYFREWIEKGILSQDNQLAVYFYNHEYSLKGERKSRLGFIALLRLPEGDSKVFAHEHTRLEPKEDRLQLIRQVKANLSPIFVLFSDKGRVVQRLFDKDVSPAKPFIDITDEEKGRHCLWRVTSPEIVEAIVSQLKGKDIFIADGHHRYEVAECFRQEVRKAKGELGPEDKRNYIMAYFTNIESKGLVILPIHRLVKGLVNLNMAKFLATLKEHFLIEEIKDKADLFLLMHQAGKRQHALGMYKDRMFYLLRLKNAAILSEVSDKAKPDEYNNLDISILNSMILKKVFGLDLEDKERIAYSQDADYIISLADEENSRIAFLLNPVNIEQMVAVASKSVRMPSKSTFFYPKVLSGLVINKL